MEQYIIDIDDRGEETAKLNPEWARERSRQKYELYLAKSGIPSFYHNIEFRDYQGNQQSEEFKKVLYYANNLDNPEFEHTHLYIYGVNSSQKSAIACNILKKGITKGLKAKFVQAGNLMKALMKTQGFSEDIDSETLIKELQEADVICIDDVFDPDKIGLWKNSDNKNLQVSEWDNFLRELSASKTKVVMTSNFNLDIIEQYYSRSLFELVERNYVLLKFNESIKTFRKDAINRVVSIPEDFNVEDYL